MKSAELAGVAEGVKAARASADGGVNLRQKCVNSTLVRTLQLHCWPSMCLCPPPPFGAPAAYLEPVCA